MGLAPVHDAGQPPAQSQLCPRKVCKAQWHPGEAGFEFCRSTADPSFENCKTARKSDLRRGQRIPAAVERGDDGAARHGDRATAIFTLRNSGYPVRTETTVEFQREPVCAATRYRALKLAAPVHYARIRCKTRNGQRTIGQAGAIRATRDRHGPLTEPCDGIDIGRCQCNLGVPAEACVVRSQVQCNTLLPLSAHWGDPDRTVEPASVKRERSRNACLAQGQVAGNVGAVNLQAINLDLRRSIGGKKEAQCTLERAKE